MNVSKLRKNFPPASGKYKVCINGGDKWSLYDHARLQISISQEKHTGDKFAATMEWASHRFQSQTLIISDTLQRHNYIANGCTPNEAMHRAYQEGLEWFEKNRETIEQHQNIEITFWNDWINHPEFDQRHQTIKSAYATDMTLNRLINETANHFAQNHKDKAKGFQSSLNYILEELAAFSIMYQKENTIDIYPGIGLRETLLYLKESLPALFNGYAGTQTDFVRNKGYKPQSTQPQAKLRA